MKNRNEPLNRAFHSLSSIYDTLDGTDIREDMTSVGYPESESNEIQDTINRLMTLLEDTLPGMEMEINEN